MTEEAIAAAAAQPALPTRTAGAFRNPATLGKWVIALLLGVGGASTLAFAAIFARQMFLENIAAGAYRSRSSLMATAYFMDTLVQIASFLYLGLWIIAGIVFLCWVYRSNRNAREMGVADLKFTPGWAVGCYFAPVVNLWLPFQAMKEIWSASLGGVEGEARPVYLVGWWWGLYLAHSVAGGVAGIQSRGAKTVADFLVSGRILMASHALCIVSSIVALVMVRRICANQIRVWRMSEVFA